MSSYLKHKIIVFISISFLAQFNIQAQENINSSGNGKGKQEFENKIKLFESPDRERWQKPDEVISLFGEIQGKTIMDLGAGSGYFTFRLAKKGARVIAADVDDRYQDYIFEKLKKPEFSGIRDYIEPRKIGYDNPGLKEGEADGLLIVDTYHHLRNRVSYLKLTLSGLKNNGKIIIVDYKKGISFGPPENHKLDMKIVCQELEQVGFSRISADVNLLAYQYVIICYK
jgi:2-polyprenyl-3-methyl-5-hydroxy-6-metoxy-1,4-benzoquinol methylase